MSEWHRETFSHAADTLREALEEEGFRVHFNRETITIIAPNGKALALTPTSSTRIGTLYGRDLLRWLESERE